MNAKTTAKRLVIDILNRNEGDTVNEVVMMPVGSKLDDLFTGWLGRLVRLAIGETAFNAIVKIKDLLANGQMPNLADGYSAGTLVLTVKTLLGGLKDSTGTTLDNAVYDWIDGFGNGLTGVAPVPMPTDGSILFGSPADDLASQVVLPANATDAEIREAVTARAGRMKFFPGFELLLPIIIELVIAWIKKRKAV